MKGSFTAFAALTFYAFTLGCGGSRMEPRQMLSLDLQPAFATPAPGVEVKFNATGSFSKPPSPAKVDPMIWVETARDGLHEGLGVATVDQSGLAHCVQSGRTWITATAFTGTLNQFRDPALIRGTAQLDCP